MAASARSDHADGNKGDRAFCGEEGHQHLRFRFETIRLESQRRPGGKVDKPETALRVGQAHARPLRQFAAHPTVHPAPQPGNGGRMGHAVADYEQSAGLISALQKSRKVVRRVLAVAIESEGPIIALSRRQGEAGPECRAFAEISIVRDNGRARVFGQGGGAISRAIVHHDHAEKMPPRRADDRCDAGALVESGDYGSASCHIEHIFNLS